MSPPSDNPSNAPRGVFVRKQGMNIYTTLLILSFIAIVIACILLSMEMSRYGWDMKAQDTKLSAAQRPQPALYAQLDVDSSGARMATG